VVGQLAGRYPVCGKWIMCMGMREQHSRLCCVVHEVSKAKGHSRWIKAGLQADMSALIGCAKSVLPPLVISLTMLIQAVTPAWGPLTICTVQ
jgi:hypothetical protein